MRIVIDLFIVCSIFFAFAGVVGVLKMPDTFCRMQASTLISTFGVLGVVIGGIIYSIAFLGNGEMAVKIAVLGVFYIVTSPISGHALAKGAYHHRIKPVAETVCDKYGEDLE